MKLKVCGMREAENIAALTELKPDYIGFIFWAPSSRYVNDNTPKLPKSIKKTGVFVDASLDYIQSCIETHHLQAVQLHGKETPEYCSFAKDFGVEIIKAFSVKESFDFTQLEPYEDSVDYFLFDTKGALPGGNGYAFDWTILNDYPNQNLSFKRRNWPSRGRKNKTIIKTDLALYAIDVNSKFETSPARKDIAALSRFKKNSMNYNVDEKGYYGDFGGAFIPEMLYPNVAELRENYLKITAEPSFKKN